MEELLALRRHIHQHPEPSFKEFQTSQLLKAQLIQKGLSPDAITPCFEPGFYADIVGTGPAVEHGKCIAFRTELDALTTQEDNPDLPYKSENDGVAHLCGHDGHMCIVMGTAWVLLRKRHLLPSNCKIRLLFQPAEESPPGGALPMAEAGCLEGVDEVYAFHNMNNPEGTIVCRDSTMFSQVTIVDIKVTGKGGHGAYPHLSTDCILTSAYILTQLHSVIPRNVSCFKEATLTICQLHSGSAHNVMPDSAWMEGTIRSYEEEVRAKVKERVKVIAEQTALAHGCTAEVKFEDRYPATINHSTNALYVRQAAARAFGADQVVDFNPSVASEDFSYFLRRCPGAMVFVGNGPSTMLHKANYCFHEPNVQRGVTLWLTLLEDRMGVHWEGTEV